MLQSFARIERDFSRPKNRKFDKNIDIRWRVVYPNPDSLGVKKESFKNEEDALKRLTFLNQAQPKELEFEKWTVFHCADFWEKNKLNTLRSFKRELSKVKLIKKLLGEIRLVELNEEHIRKFRNFLQKDKCIRTVNAYLVTLRAMLNFSKRKGKCSSFPDISDYIDSSLEVRRDRVITSKEFEGLLNACAVKRQGRDRLQLVPYLIWLHETGCRTGELAQIRVKDINLARGVVKIWSGKSKRQLQRECGITSRLKNLIVDSGLLDRGKEELVFNNQSEWKRSFKTACRIAGIEGFRMHDLRRTAITNMLEKGIPLHLVAKMVGHSSNSVLTLDVYTRFRADFIQEMMLRMD